MKARNEAKLAAKEAGRGRGRGRVHGRAAQPSFEEKTFHLRMPDITAFSLPRETRNHRTPSSTSVLRCTARALIKRVLEMF